MSNDIQCTQLLMESIAEIAEILRRSTVSQNTVSQSTEAQLVQRGSPSAESVRTVDHTPNVRRKRKRIPTCGAQGSKPNLVENSEKRSKMMNKLLQTEGIMSQDAGKNACLAEFKWRLLAYGFSEGSWKHASGCNKECNRSCAGFCKNDGNPHTYPRYMGLFFDAGIVTKRSDFFVASAHAKAKEFSIKRAKECAVKSKKWNEMSDEKQQSLVTKMAGNIMHGFTDFKWCPNTSLGYVPINVAQEMWPCRMADGEQGQLGDGAQEGEPNDNLVVGNPNTPSVFYKPS